MVELCPNTHSVFYTLCCCCEQVRDTVACREQEDRQVQLLVSPWMTEGAVRARRQRQEMVGHTHTNTHWCTGFDSL